LFELVQPQEEAAKKEEETPVQVRELVVIVTGNWQVDLRDLVLTISLVLAVSVHPNLVLKA
jgi:hypothetical protein